MTGLNLEPFLRLLRADYAAWVSLAAIVVILGLMTWTSWGSRRALRKCLFLSVLVHAGLVFFGEPILPNVIALRPRDGSVQKPRIRQIRVEPRLTEAPGDSGKTPRGAKSGQRLAPWDRPTEGLALAAPSVRPPRPEMETPESTRAEASASPPAGPEAKPAERVPDPPRPETGPDDGPKRPVLSPPAAAPVDSSELRDVVLPDTKEADEDAHPSRRTTIGGDQDTNEGAQERPRGEPSRRRSASVDLPTVPRRSSSPTADSLDGPRADPTSPFSRNSPNRSMPDVDLRSRVRAGASRAQADLGTRRSDAAAVQIARATPTDHSRVPDVTGAIPARNLSDVPVFYRSRLDPNRSALARRSGASDASELAVERALDWLKRHQDADGRWNGGTAKDADNSVVAGDTNFTAHCPAGQTCYGECFYWEADTAMTGLALLAYLGAGYTHADGKYASTVTRGLQYLLATQKRNGDLRGESRVVGMYCHLMAGLALCEAYALTGDPKLKEPVSRAVDFLVKGRAWDGQSWRYEPLAKTGDTSLLGWAILMLKSAKLSHVSIPANIQTGALKWLDQVADGPESGLARYRPFEELAPGDVQAVKVTPSMTAEAWVCRQFLGVGGPGPASTEAAEYLLRNGPDRQPYNLYYWYYGTLAMYQYGGEPWQLWNRRVRDQLVSRQVKSGHSAGSWEPDNDKYGSRGGRIYSTALAALTLEVYYRYLRLYEEPGVPPALAPAPERPSDARLRRAGASSD
jgi:hypothetical protein